MGSRRVFPVSRRALRRTLFFPKRTVTETTESALKVSLGSSSLQARATAAAASSRVKKLTGKNRASPR